MPNIDDGPKSELSRYAFGWSNKKPSLSYWIILGGMIVYVGYNMFTITYQIYN